MRRRLRSTIAWRPLPLSLLLVGAMACPAQAREGLAPVITVAEPAGFADLTREQTLLVDVYFGGTYRGEAKVRATPGSVTFLDPQALIHLLPDVSDGSPFAAFLAGRALPANSEMSCTRTTDQAVCGRLAPETLGVIFDREHFRVDVFLNPRFLSVHDEAARKYLPEPDRGISAVNAIGALYAGQSSVGHDYYNLYDNLIVGNGERRLRADLSVADNVGFGAETLAFEWDRPELRYSAGALWTRGNDIYGRRKLIGGGIATQIDTRLDKDAVYGNPIVVYLDRRARVDVLRDGRILSSAIYDAGNQQIDTASLPDGSYDIVLRIEEAGQPAREEHRFYSKSQRIPSLGRTDFYAFGGMLVKGSTTGSIDPSNHPYFEAGVTRRMGQHWAVEGNVQASDHTAAAELGATLVTPFALVRFAGVADTAGTVGGILQLSSTGNSRLNFNFDLRTINSGADLSAVPSSAEPVSVTPSPAAPQSVFGSPYLDSFVTSYTQLSGSMSYSRANLRITATGIYRREASGRARYSVGPSIDWEVLRTSPFRISLRGDLAATEKGTTAFAGIALELRKGVFALDAQGGQRFSSIASDELGKGAQGSIQGSVETEAAGGEFRLATGYQHAPEQENEIVSSEFRHPLATLTGDFVHSHTAISDVSQYTMALQTTVTAGGGGVHVAGQTTTESLIVVRVDGARANDRFDVLVNEQVAGTIVGRHALTVELPAYRQYKVRIRPVSEDLLAYDSSDRVVGLYPGVVSKLVWTSAPITMKFGRLVDPGGRAIARASITGKGVWSETDDGGNFEIEAPDNARLTVTTREGRSYEIALPAGHGGAQIARLGPVVCCEVDTIRLGALDLPVNVTAKELP